MGAWTDKKIEKLKILWEKGVSTAEIGKRLDFSKNAIVGKVHRLGLSNRNSPIKPSASKVEKAEKIEKIEKVSEKTTAKSTEKSKKSAANKQVEVTSQDSKKSKETPQKVEKTEVETSSKVENKQSKSSPKNDSQKNQDVATANTSEHSKQKKVSPELDSDEVETGVPLIELGSDRCCWPIDDPSSGSFHFCGKKVFKNKPYCLEHCAMAYTTLASSKNGADKLETKKEKDTE